MAKLIFKLLLTLVLSYLSDIVNAKLNFKATSVDVEGKLKQLNKPAVKTIQSEDGDIIDCVDIYKQPAFDHPALKNHIIQMKPSFDLKEEILSKKNDSPKLMVSQTWQRSGSCPKGSVPIRRIRRENLLRADSISQFGRKPQEIIFKSNASNHKNSRYPFTDPKENWPISLVDRTSATLYTHGSYYVGAKGDINVWNPNVLCEDDFTTAQIWVKAGSGESVEAGWMVNPKFYGDKRTRFFTSWSNDGYKSTGCFDLACSGFVHTSTEIALGAFIEPVSSQSEQQFKITIGIYMDPLTSNWWLKYDDTPIGYWPTSSLMSHLNFSATYVEWGGQVYSSNVKKKPHTATDMGSGQFASELYKVACYIDNIGIVEINSLVIKYPDNVDTWADEPSCYSVENHQKSSGDSSIFYFGGPGLSNTCP